VARMVGGTYLIISESGSAPDGSASKCSCLKSGQPALDYQAGQGADACVGAGEDWTGG
jgi:hypothetical protein